MLIAKFGLKIKYSAWVSWIVVIDGGPYTCVANIRVAVCLLVNKQNYTHNMVKGSIFHLIAFC